MTGVKVAILDGEFDLNHMSGKLAFTQPHHNATNNSNAVDIANDHAHGTLCSGIIGAEPYITDWPEGGVFPGVNMLPVSVYRTTSPVRAVLNDLIDGISFAVDQHCKVISISLSGFPPASSLVDAVDKAEIAKTLLVAGTGNRRVAEPGDPGFVGYPARFATVVGVGAATVKGLVGAQSLQRVSIKSSSEADADPAWESRFGIGLDVVAQGLGVNSTDISDIGGANRRQSPEGDVWNGFSGTSAGAPLVAAFAALIASGGVVSPSVIRRKIRLAAEKIGPKTYTKDRDGIMWNRRVGFGWIGRGTIENWQDGEDDKGRNAMTGTDDSEESAVPCGVDEEIGEFEGVDGFAYVRMFEDAMRPLGDFLAALGSWDEKCCRMAAHFWIDPYRTARIAGLPWHAAILLGSGDWAAVYEAVSVEYHDTPMSDRAPGPIWVRVH